MFKILTGASGYVYAAIGIAVFAAFIGLLAYVNNRAYERGKVQAEIACFNAMEKIRLANETAIASARVKLQIEAEKTDRAEKVLEITLQEIEKNAAKDPDADRCGINADSVRQLDSVK